MTWLNATSGPSANRIAACAMFVEGSLAPLTRPRFAEEETAYFIVRRQGA